MAVEFALLAGPFLFLLVAIVEIAMVFWSTQVLETAVANASRELYTGQFQQDPENKALESQPEKLRAKMKDKVCAYAKALFDCETKVSVDVQTFSNYALAADQKNPTDTQGNYDTSSYSYKGPTANDISIVRASMEYPIFLPMLSQAGRLASGNRLIVATATFRTEPFPTN